MSALTDLFSSYANKIRSKVGGSETYTPTEMVDAIDDVYDAGAASVSLQASKTVTATTSSQTVEPDTGYVGMEEVVVNPQAHTTTYTPATNTSANDMGANHDYRYVDTSGMITPTGTKRITLNGTSDVTNYATVDVDVTTTPTETLLPSNSDPYPIYNGHDYRSQGNGYAIASYDEITPSSYYEEVSSGDIVKFGGNGWVSDEAPEDITPSNSAPPILRDFFPFKVTTNGFAIESYDSVIPSSTPTSVSNGDIVKIGGSGVIVDSIPVPPSVTPSNSSPATLTSGTAVNPTANGYAVADYTTIYPSNSQPEALTADEIYHPVANGYAIQRIDNYVYPSNIAPVQLNEGDIISMSDDGYAIESFTNVTPSSTPEAVTAGDMVQINGSGVIVDSIPTPTSITPSNSSPATITSGETYTATANGKAVSSVTDITPSNSSPVSLSSGSIYKPSASGYAISSYSSKTPSDSSPASVSSGAIIKASSSGYLYSSSGLGKRKSGTFTSSTSSQTINLGFQPKYLLVMTEGRTSNIFDYSYSSTKAVYATTSSGNTEYTISGNTSTNHIGAISSTGFTYNKSGSAGSTIYYFAVG